MQQHNELTARIPLDRKRRFQGTRYDAFDVVERVTIVIQMYEIAK